MLTTLLTFDTLGREQSREVSDGSQSIWKLEQSWYANHQIKMKTFSRGGKQVRVENFTYDERNRLINFTVTGSELPKDAKGNSITSEAYKIDVYGNITQFTINNKDITRFAYNNVNDPCQLSTITLPSLDSITLGYDANGMVINDGAFTYNYKKGVSWGYIDSITSKTDSTVYNYDPQGRILLCQTTGNKSVQGYRCYQGSDLINLLPTQDNGAVIPDQIVSITRGAGGVLALETAKTTTMMTSDANGSVLNDVGQCYTPYGEINNTKSTLGFNGELIEPVSGNYLLGNGYRMYAPGLKRFLAPDSMSPFGQGGINAYAYCAGDPINNTDPTGHTPVTAMFLGWYNTLSPIKLPENFTVEGIAASLRDSAIRVGLDVETGGEAQVEIDAERAGTRRAEESIAAHDARHAGNEAAVRHHAQVMGEGVASTSRASMESIAPLAEMGDIGAIEDAAPPPPIENVMWQQQRRDGPISQVITTELEAGGHITRGAAGQKYLRLKEGIHWEVGYHRRANLRDIENGSANMVVKMQDKYKSFLMNDRIRYAQRRWGRLSGRGTPGGGGININEVGTDPVTKVRFVEYIDRG